MHWGERLLRGLVIMLAAALTGCTVGPDFSPPPPPQVPGYTRAPMPQYLRSVSGAPAQSLRMGRQVAQRWWRLFRSQPLDSVVHTAVLHSPTLAAARATLRAAQAEVAAARGGLWPQANASATTGREGGGGVAPTNVYSVGATVSFAVDVFGGVRRGIEQQQALADYQRYQLAAAYLSLTGNVVTSAVNLASVDAQLRAIRAIVRSDRHLLSLVVHAYAAGKVARGDVLTARTQLASDLAALPPLRQQRSAARHALAVLAGRAPAAWRPPAFALQGFALPSSLPLSLPSTLVRHRPDILAATARLHADSAAIGVATANLYPDFTLSASADQQSFNAGELFTAANRLWNLSAAMLAPVFQGGTLRARRRAAVQAYRAALATYEETVLQGLLQVADTLRALQEDVRLVDAQQALLQSANASRELQRMSYLAGKSTLLNWIDAQRSYQRARLGLVRARAQRLQDTAQLFVALGGGWWHQPALLTAAARSPTQSSGPVQHPMRNPP